ncbi:MAG: CoA-acylating methylmalonate-semialdehyde dehydrogenase [bacterium]|nr:CoA-acylating methylmalonate-semialdehyde dehydrogenase [bacterium]
MNLRKLSPANPQTLQHWVDGTWTPSKATETLPIYNPATGEHISSTPMGTKAEVDHVVQSAKTAFQTWSETPAPGRAKILFNYRQCLMDHTEELADLIGQEHGKSMVEARGSLARGLDALEFACSIPHHMRGDFTENVGRGIDAHSIRQPLGVCVGITPFNFPAMIPLWIGALALGCGNTFILKPSEKNPSAPLRMAELAFEAGFPKGVFNAVLGGADVVNHLIEHPDVAAISFVGQSSTAHTIQKAATKHHKRVQAFGGAKNHMILMPDAPLEKASEALLGAAYGSAGERCMAISVAVCVGDKIADQLVKDLAPKIKTLTIGAHDLEGQEMGPLISAEHRQKVLDYVEAGVKEGATLVIDGRNYTHPKHPEGFYMGGCLFDHVTSTMSIYQQEIFGPVLCIVRASSYEEALNLASTHPYGNGVSLFTSDGDCARDFTHRVNVGMVGVNIPIPVPAAFHSFGGWKDSNFSDHGMHGMEGVRFFTKLKTVTSRWPSGIRQGNVEFSLPTVGT